MKKQKSKKLLHEPDGIFFFKLVMYLILGSVWFRIQTDTMQIPIPLGFIIGSFLTLHDRFQIDRKIEYAILLIAMFVSFWLPLGMTLNL